MSIICAFVMYIGMQRNLHKPCITSTTWNFPVQFFSVEEEEDEGSDLATKIFPTASLHKYSREKAFKLQTEALALDHFPYVFFTMETTLFPVHKQFHKESGFVM